MGVRKVGPVAGGILALITLSGIGSLASAPGRNQSNLSEAFELAYRFASAIHSDPKDQAAAQQVVTEDVASEGAFDDALRMADGIRGWRHSAALATIASKLAAAGKADRAKGVLSRAREAGAKETGWQRTRIDALIAEAEAALGNADEAKRLAQQVSEGDPRQYAGRSAAIQARGTAAKNDFAGAMTYLENLDTEKDAEIARWRTSGYADLAGDTTLPREQRLKALEASVRSSETLFGWQRAEALENLTRRALALDAASVVRPAAERAEKDLVPAEGRGSASASAGLARIWALLGEAERGRKLLRQAEPWVPYELDIDRPGVYAYMAGGWTACGDVAAAARIYDLAFAAAESLVNLRPRALAGVEICRSLGKSGAPLTDPVRSRLNQLLNGVTAARN